MSEADAGRGGGNISSDLNRLDVSGNWRLPGHDLPIHRRIRSTLRELRLGEPVVEASGIVKRFGQLAANNGVEFSLAKGEVHGLLGQNGAGKSTFVKILFGLVRPDEGVLRIAGNEVSLKSPQDSLRLGIGMVHQDLQLVNPLSVAENLFLGLRSPRILIRARDRNSVAATLLRAGGLGQVNPTVAVGELPIGVQQQIEILKVLIRGAKILILDEPTATLTPIEVEGLFTNLETLRRVNDLSIILISHKFKEVLSVCDRITVLRDGRTVSQVERSDASPGSLAADVLGERAKDYVNAPRGTKDRSSKHDAVVLSVRGLSTTPRVGQTNLEGVSLEVRSGETLGIVGVSGNGQTTLVRVLIGLQVPDSGEVDFVGVPIYGRSVKDIRGFGMAVIPEDRDREGLFMPLSLQDNILAGRADRFTNWWGLYRQATQARWVASLVSAFEIAATDLAAPVQELSGGNRQKALLARELSKFVRLVLACEPSRGLDIAASQNTRALLNQSAAEWDAGVLVLTSDVDEALDVCDSISVMYRGRLSQSFRIGEIDRNYLAELMGGAGWSESRPT